MTELHFIFLCPVSASRTVFKSEIKKEGRKEGRKKDKKRRGERGREERKKGNCRKREATILILESTIETTSIFQKKRKGDMSSQHSFPPPH